MIVQTNTNHAAEQKAHLELHSCLRLKRSQSLISNSQRIKVLFILFQKHFWITIILSANKMNAREI